MNKRKVGLVLTAVLMVGVLLVGSTGCGEQKAPDELSQLQKDMAQVQKDIGQLLQEKQEQKTQEQKAAEEEKTAQIVAKAVEEKLRAFEAKLAEKEKEDKLAELEKKIAELESQSTQPSCDVYPSPDPYFVPTVIWFEGGNYRFRYPVDPGHFQLYIDGCRYTWSVPRSYEVICHLKTGYHSLWLGHSGRRIGCADISWQRVNSYYLWR